MLIKRIEQTIKQALKGELKRTQKQINLIASENYVSSAVLKLQGSIFTNKYAEGYPHKRYYGGCKFVDICEELAIHRAKELFQADFANVQPHSGSQANGAAYLALIEPNDMILGMNLSDGGHLTHGAKVSFSGKFYRVVQYGVDKNSGEIDYNQVEDLAKKYRPKLIIAGFSAYSRIIDWEKFRFIADKVSAFLLADIAHVAGLIAAKIYPSPVNIADVTTSTTHKTLRGPRGGLILARDNPEIFKKLNSAVFPGMQGGPLAHVIAAKAQAFYEASQPEFLIYQKQIVKNAKVMANRLQHRGFEITSGGTDNHMFLVDLRMKNMTGNQAKDFLSQSSIIVNRNNLPNDPTPPTVTGGLRIGTPAITTRGFKEEESILTADFIADILDHPDNNQIEKTKEAVEKLTCSFPIYADYEIES